MLSRMGLEHIGEWHSHHSLNLPTPSGGDCRTVVGAMRDYNRDRFILCIATVTWNLPPSPSSSSMAPPNGSNSPPPPAAAFPPPPIIGGTPGGMVPISSIRGSVARSTAIPYVFINGAARYRKIKWQSSGDISPHASFAPVDRLSRPVTVNAGQWYASGEGKLALAAIISECKIEFGDAKITRVTSTHDLELSFPTFTLSFPSSFPRSMAIIRRNQPSSAAIAAAATGYMRDGGGLNHREVRYRLPESGPTAKIEAKPFVVATLAATIELGIQTLGII
jgi:hypothetical protein